jgi:hypothetical protein
MDSVEGTDDAGKYTLRPRRELSRERFEPLGVSNI